MAAKVGEGVRPKAPSPFGGLVRAGVDGASCCKGHKCPAVAAGHGTGAVVWAHKGHGKGVPREFFALLGTGQGASTRAVTGGGARRIADCVAEPRPNATRPSDGPRAAQWAADALDAVRRRAASEPEGSEKAAKRPPGGPKRGDEAAPSPSEEAEAARCALLESPAGLTDAQQAKLGAPPSGNGQMGRGRRPKEGLRPLLKPPAEEAEGELGPWLGGSCRCRAKEFVGLSKKVRRHRKRILGSAASGPSNARVEAMNNKIKVTQGTACGLKNADSMIAMIMLRCPKLPISRPGRCPPVSVA
ncbi:MAG: transposase [Actinomycetia bacterium]|nr:transposase [Actinomycetes bacterium]